MDWAFVCCASPDPVGSRPMGVNRTQKLVLAFLWLAWAGAITIVAAAPQVYAPALRRALVSLGAAEVLFVIAITGLIGVISAGVVRRWRWVFWVIVAVFFLGVLRVPVAALQVTGHIAAGDPTWYVVVQAVAGVIQFAIALAMLTGYRRSGVWGAF
jgi:hypothetical protein